MDRYAKSTPPTHHETQPTNPKSPTLINLIQKTSRWMLFAAAALCLQPAISRAAGAATGTISGRVLNTDTGKYLNNARIEVEGTHLQTFTNKFGEYELDNVPVGPVKVDIFYTGLSRQTLSVNVAAGQTAQQDVSMSSSAEGGAIKLDAFVVAAAKETDQSSIAINEERFAPNLKTVVSTDQFGDIVEGNIGEFVKFLPGISVGYTASDVRNVSVRGVGSQYTAIMLDGYRVASADSGNVKYSSTGGGSRTTELEQISINNAARTEIVKSRTPDLPADALGGSLNMVSKSAFEYAHPEFNYRVLMAMNSNAKKLGASPGPANDGTSHKVLPSFDFTYALPVNKHFGITLSFLDSNIFNVQYRSNPQWTPNGTHSNVSGAPSNFATDPYLEKYTVQDGPKTTHRKAAEFTADWKLSDRDLISLRVQDNFYSSFFGNRNINFDTGTTMPLAYTQTATNGALGKGKVNFGSSFRHKFGVTYNLGADYTHTGEDWTFNAGINFSHASAHYQDANEGYFDSVTYQISSATVNYGMFNGIAPQQIQVFDKSGKDTLGNVFDVRNPNYKITKVENNPVSAADSFFTQQANFKRDFDWAIPTKIKFGGQLQFEHRDVRNNKIDWTPTGALAAAGAAGAYNLVDSTYNVAPPYIPYPVVWPSQSKLYSLYLSNPSLFSPSSSNEQQRILGSLLFKELISAAYMMGDSQMFNSKLRLVYGVRFEQTTDEGYGPLAKKTGSSTTYVERGAFAKNTYNGTYPSISAVYNITDNLLLRAAYDRAVGRPDLANIVPNVALPDSASTGAAIGVSNPLLKPEQANNYDLSLEYYFKHAGVLSLGVFRKDFTGFWGQNNVTGPEALAILNSLGVPNGQDYLDQGDYVSTIVNSGTAHITGVEFNYRQSLEQLSQFTRHLSVFANATGLHLQGAANADFSAFVSKTINWGLAYDNRRVSAKLNFNYRGREVDAPTTVNGVVYQEYFSPRLYLDANLVIRLTKRFSLFINGRNLTDVPQDDQRYAPGITPDYARLYRREMFGTAYTFGIKGSF
ncbi:catecholate siderophore receptor CirA [mine drainage metagenome]|uniref:Catecholate siderophore receptor CirA n=1 Tax=mine drainage metagenome TaxID=410659 RepID=A0A1J5T288_9ZZZZ